MKPLRLSLAAIVVLSGSSICAEDVPQGLEKGDWHSIRTAHEAWKHSFQTTPEGRHESKNPGQGWNMTFDGRGFLARPSDGSWEWGLELSSYGFQGHEQKIDSHHRAKSRAESQRLAYHWDSNLEEWYINDSRGLEHGFTIQRRPAGGGESPLMINMKIRGNLQATVATDGQSVGFQTDSGVSALTYGGLKVWDADGKSLTAKMLGEPAGGFRFEVMEQGARYPITIDPIAQQAYLKAGNNAPPSNDLFGYSIAMSGDSVVVGAPGEDGGGTGVDPANDNNVTNAGAAYVFVRSGNTWSQQAYLKASNTGTTYDNFGNSVSISGDTIVVGAIGEDGNGTGVNPASNESSSGSGAAYVFTRSGETWSQQAYLKASNTNNSDEFGHAVDVDGDLIVVGARLEDSGGLSSGAAYVFARSGNIWSQQALLKALNSGSDDLFGNSVAISGNTIAIGALAEDGGGTGFNPPSSETANGSGAAYVFIQNGITWSQQAYIKASNTGSSDGFGSSIDISDNTMVVGARQESGSGTGVDPADNNSAGLAGAAYVFERTGTTWVQQAYLKASNTGGGDLFGTSVAVSNDLVVVGAYNEDGSGFGINPSSDNSAVEAGAAYVFVRNSGSWTHQAYLKASNSGNLDIFGFSVAASGDTVVIGAMEESGSGIGSNPPDNNSSPGAGAAFVFERSGIVWSQQAYLKASNTGEGTGESDGFGNSVAISGDTIVVGASGEDGSGSGFNPASDEGAIESGAVYVFIRNGGTWFQQAYLKASNVQEVDYFGASVAISGDTIVIGAPFEDSSTTGINSTGNNSASDAGAAYVFVRSGNNWSEQAYLKASNTGANDRFGTSVGISGDTVVVGAFQESGNGVGVDPANNNSAGSSGAAYVFQRTSTTWSQQAYLKASNTGVDDRFGYTVAISGDTVVVGAYGEDGSGTGINPTSNDSLTDSGAVYVFVRNANTWSHQAYLKASNPGGSDFLGISLAFSVDTIVVGSPGEDGSGTGVNPGSNESSSNSGAAYVFARSGNIWNQQAYLKASNTGSSDSFGGALGISGDLIAIGAVGEDGGGTGVNPPDSNTASLSGCAYTFIRTGSSWSGSSYLKAFNSGAQDQFGTSIAVSGDTVVVGSRYEDGSGKGVNPASDEITSSSGAAYVFANQAPPTPEISISGNGMTIANGDSSPTPSDHTDFGSIAVEGSGLSRTFTILNSGMGTLNLTDPAPNHVAISGNSAFSVIVQPVTFTVDPDGGTTTFVVLFDPSTIGLANATISIANDDPDDNPFTFTIQGTGVTAIAAFDDFIASSSTLSGPQAAADAIPFNDGIENLLKYAFNMNLTGPDVSGLTPGNGNSGLPSITSSGSGENGMLCVEFVQRVGSGLIYTPKKSSSLTPGSFTPLSVTPVITPIGTDGLWQRVTYDEPVNLNTTPTCFSVVEVTLP